MERFAIRTRKLDNDKSRFRSYENSPEFPFRVVFLKSQLVVFFPRQKSVTDALKFSVYEGIEVNLLGLTFGIDHGDMALKPSAIGRIGP